MGREFKKFLVNTLILVLAFGSAIALESEYKNSLFRVELVKTGEDNYNVDLYTQKGYTQTPKVIKKSDYSYYILLPETKNTENTVSPNGQDIKTVSSHLYPYAGQDINNGYTKINISTTKPVTFNVNVKSSTPKTAAASQSSKPAQPVQEKLAEKKTTTATPAKTQTQDKTVVKADDKKQQQTAAKPVQLKPQQNIQNKTQTASNTQNATKTADKATIATIKPKQNTTVAQNTIKSTDKTANAAIKQTTATAKTQDKKVATKSVKQQEAVKSKETVKQKETVKAKETAKPKENVKPKEQAPKKQAAAKKQDIHEDTVKTEDGSNADNSSYSQGDIFIPRANNDFDDDEMFTDDIESENPDSFIERVKLTLKSLTDKDKFSRFGLFTNGIGVKELFLIFLATFIVLFMLLKIMFRRKNTKTKRQHTKTQKDKSKTITSTAPARGIEEESKAYDVQNHVLEVAKERIDNSQEIRNTQNGSQYSLHQANIQQNIPPVQNDEFLPPPVEEYGLSEDDLELYSQQHDDSENEQVQIQPSKEEIEPKPEIRQELKIEPKPELRVEPKPELRIEPKPQVNQNIFTETIQIPIKEHREEIKITASNVPPKAPAVNPNSMLNSEVRENFVKQEPVNRNIVKPDSIEEDITRPKPSREPARPSSPAQPKKTKPAASEEIKVLSKAEIAPGRGFMCVSYDGSIRLVGYIFDDVYALYNFKTPSLSNYDIHFRLSERDEKSALFLVKIEDTKMLIKATRISMELEVVM